MSATPFFKKNGSGLRIVVVVLFGILVYGLAKQVGWLGTKSGVESPVEVQAPAERSYTAEAINLPTPRTSSNVSVELALQGRRSRRSFTDRPVTLAQVSQMVWAAQGITTDWGGRTAPSAKEAYPLELTVVAKNVTGLEPGVYHYLPQDHQLRATKTQVPQRFNEAAVQAGGQNAPVALVISADFGRMTEAFDGEAHDENVYLEAGHAAQNLYLQAESLRLGTVVIGGFNPVLMQEALQIPAKEKLIYLVPFGWPSE